MRRKMKAYATAIAAFLVFSFAIVSIAVGAGAITLTPTAQAPGASVTVSGTGFGATKSVGIGFGAEVASYDTNMAYSGTGMGPYTGRVSNYPIKPGSFILTSDTSSGGGIVSTYTDVGDGTTMWSYDGTIMGTINYTSGVWTRTTTVDVTGYATIYSANYTRYQYNVTSAAGVTTIPSGTFTASITVPTVANGDYNVTAIDSQGNWARATLSVSSAIPEGLTIGIMVLLSSLAVIASARSFRKRPRVQN
jgi:hypothetical protein